MPHYADGSPAQVGDLVLGKTYNRPEVEAGVILEITSHHDTCNCKVARGFKTVQGDPRYYPVVVSTDWDYGETKAFTLLAKAFSQSLAPIEAVE